jgi:hypothetical protein
MVRIVCQTRFILIERSITIAKKQCISAVSLVAIHLIGIVSTFAFAARKQGRRDIFLNAFLFF